MIYKVFYLSVQHFQVIFAQQRMLIIQDLYNERFIEKV